MSVKRGVQIEWGKGGFAQEDWKYIYEKILQYKIKTVLEYGCGLSTELLHSIGMKVVSLEDDKEWYDLYKPCGWTMYHCPYENGYPESLGEFDLGFVDGPSNKGGKHRKRSVEHAMVRCKYLYLHDYGMQQFEVLKQSDVWISLEPYKEKHNHFFYRKNFNGF